MSAELDSKGLEAANIAYVRNGHGEQGFRAALHAYASVLQGKLAAAEAERDELDFLYHEGGTMEEQLSKAESALSDANKKVEELTAEKARLLKYVPVDFIEAALSNQSTASLKGPDAGKMVDALLAKEEADLVLYRDEHCQGDSAIKQFHHTFAEGRIAEVKSLRSKLSAILAHASQPAEGQGERGEAEPALDDLAKAISRHNAPEECKGDGFAWWWHDRYNHPGNDFAHECREEDRCRARDVLALFATPPAPQPLEGAVKEAIQNADYICGQWEKNHPSSLTIAVRTLLSALSAPAGDGWRAMDSAPKDGTPFIAAQGEWIYRCQWLLEEADEGASKEGWFDLENMSFEEPTHWLPYSVLPPLPASPYQGDGR